MYPVLYERLTMIRENSDEKYNFFIKRTNAHIERVKNAAAKIVSVFPEFTALTTQVEDHDASKFKEPEMAPYIELTWARKDEPEAKVGNQDAITQATLHHIKNNKHHPEYHLKDKTKANLDSTNRDDSIECVDASAMDDISVAEMVADWQAMAEELKTNKAREWYNKVKGTRWSFSNEQEQLIDELLAVFEDTDDVY